MIRVALIGAGGMARTYRKVYSTLPGVEFALAVDPSESARQAAAADGAKRTSAQFEDALGPDIDMVDISTPNHLHEQQAIAALNAGKSVFLQKPMANTLAAADNILAAARRSRGVLGMFMSSYNNPLVWDVKRLIDEGLLGQIQSVRARDAHRGGLTASGSPDNWRGNRELTGGGSFVQLSIHSINLMQWWLNTSINEIFAYSQNQYCKQIGGDDVTAAVAKMASGHYALFDSGYASELLSREIYGTLGTMRLTNWDSIIELTLPKPFVGEVIRYETPGKTTIQQYSHPPHDDTTSKFNQHRMFVEALRDGKPPHMSGDVGRRDLAVVMGAYESARTGVAVKMNQGLS